MTPNTISPTPARTVPFVYGSAGGNVLVLPLEPAKLLARLQIAVHCAASWGAFYALLPADARKELKERESKTFGFGDDHQCDWIAQQRAREPELSGAEALGRYWALLPHAERAALNDDPFRPSEWPDFRDGRPGAWATKAMHEALASGPLRDRAGQIMTTPLGGGHEDMLRVELREAGIEAERNDALVRIANRSLGEGGAEGFLAACRLVLPGPYSALVENALRQRPHWLQAPERVQLGVTLPRWYYDSPRGIADLSGMVICGTCHCLAGPWRYADPTQPDNPDNEELHSYYRHGRWVEVCYEEALARSLENARRLRQQPCPCTAIPDGQWVAKFCAACGVALIPGEPRRRDRQPFLCSDCEQWQKDPALRPVWNKVPGGESFAGQSADLIVAENLRELGFPQGHNIPLPAYFERLSAAPFPRHTALYRLCSFLLDQDKKQ